MVAAQLSEAEAARLRAEARAVAAEANAAEADQKMIAALEAAQAAHCGQKAAEAEARRAGEKTKPRRRGGSWLRKPPVPAPMRKPPWPALTGWSPTPGSLRPHGPSAIRPVSRPRRRVHAAEAELARARQGKPTLGSRPGGPARTRPREREGWAVPGPAAGARAARRSRA